MFQPGRDTNLPTSSGNVRSGLLGNSSPLFSVGGMTLTLGMAVVAILLLAAYVVLAKKR